MYNRWKKQSDELYHYGVIGMKWGVHKARKFAASGNTEGFKTVAYKLDTKATRKLGKLNARYDKQQARADRKYAQAERKASSLFTSKKSAQKAFEKASKYQFKANKAAARGKKWYDQMVKQYKKAGIPMSKENQEIGKELIRQIRANSRAMYAASYAGGK